MKFKDSISQYLDNLPNRWSANVFALAGLVNFITIIVGSAQSVYYRVTNKSTQLDSNFIRDLYLNVKGTINQIWNCVDLTNKGFLILLFIFILLLFSKTKIFLKISLSIFFIALLIYCIRLDSMFIFSYTGEVGTLFKPTYAFPYPILYLFIYFIMRKIEKSHKLSTPKALLENSKLYKISLIIFFHYSFLILILLSILGLFN